MKDISEFLESPLKYIKETTVHPQYRVRTTNSKSNLKLIKYLNNYSLMGKKHLDFVSWCIIAEEFIKGKVNHKEILTKAKQVKSCMNDNRKDFT